MLLGMALLKWGVLSGERTRSFYLRLAALTVVPGLALAAWGLLGHVRAGWTFEHGMGGGETANYWGSLLAAVGYAALVMLLARAAGAAWVKRPLEAVGQAAFSNYILQSVICTLLFYGHGFGLFGRLERIELAGVVLAVWAVELALSTWWMARYRFGPLEWVWRSLTYRKLQPMRRLGEAAAA
jgi:uncharacterized protein